MSLSTRLGLLGRKVGMMRVFTDDGDSIPVTVVDVSNNRVTQVKTPENDGYVALQVTFGARRASRVTKPIAGHLAKAGVQAGEITQEFRVTADVAALHEAGSVVAAGAVFTVGQLVDVQGTSIGKGFQGTIKRHNFVSGPKSHGSHNVRAPGSIGASAWPARVFKGIRGPGQMGNKRITQRGLKVVRVDADKNLLLVQGSVPGPKNGLVEVRTDA